MDRLVIDVGSDGVVRVAQAWGGGLAEPVAGEAPALAWPVADADLERLRWYLEQYLRAPFGVYGDEGPRIAEQLRPWGEAVFGAVFGSGAARDAYVGMRASGPMEVVVRSPSPVVLGLPWELMWDPAAPSPMALSGVSISRSLSTPTRPFEVAGQRLRVLMVISRPSGGADVGYQMIARPLLRRLAAVRGEVELVVLRPPTLAALIEELAQARAGGRPYQVVHFDGHGVLRRNRSGPLDPHVFHGGAEEGSVLFEAETGGQHPVSAGELARVLAAAEVPLVVLNACQSGAVGKELEAAVATRLLQQGIASVVAMAYNVYAVAAAEFMTAFYERLFAGGGVSAAVSAGREQLARNGGRPSPKGPLPLQDWLVPVHYTRASDVAFPQLATVTSPVPSLAGVLETLRSAPPGRRADDPLAAVGEFVGRDVLFYELEVALRRQRVVVLHGPGGTGKTELAKAFGRWWQSTGGVEDPRCVVWHSFEPGVASHGLDGVVDAVGLQVWGAEFAALDREQRSAAVQEVLREHRLLLVWDNLESVHTMPDPDHATPPLPEEEKQRLVDFLHTLAAGGRSALILTSRTEEGWLDTEGWRATPPPSSPRLPLRRIPVGGLTPEEANEYADELLAPYPAAAARRGVRAFGELQEWLDGHPLSMRLVLPHLATTEARVLLDALHGTGDLPGPQGGDRTTSLTASITYSTHHLSESTRDLLLSVALFTGVVDADVLGLFSSIEEVPGRFRGTTAGQWVAVLDEAAHVGLLTPLGSGCYRVHPVLPAHLTDQWRARAGSDYGVERAAAEDTLIRAYAAFSGWLSEQIASGDAGLAYALIALQHPTMNRMLRQALTRHRWEEAIALLQPLDDYWTARGLTQEATGWVDRVRLATEDVSGTPPRLDTPEGALWLFAVGSQANRQMRAGRLPEAEVTYRAIETMLNEQETSELRDSRLAVTYHQLGRVAQLRGDLDTAPTWYEKSLTVKEALGDRLGMAPSYHQLGRVAQDRGDLDTAATWYEKSLTIAEALGDRPGIARIYHQLGRVAQDRGDLDTAATWYEKSLTIAEALGDRPGIALSYHQLGMVAQDRGDLDTAATWYEKSLTIAEALGDRPGIARIYHQLGRVAQDRGDLDTAATWYEKSLTIAEALGNRPSMARSYHQLGMVAQLRGDLDTAAIWYEKSLTITEALGNRPSLAMTYGQLGLLAEARGEPVQALAWTIRCVTVFDAFPHPMTGPGPQHLTRLAAQLGTETLTQVWTAVTGGPVPPDVLAYLDRARTDEEDETHD